MYYKGILREAGKEVDEKHALGYAISRILSNPEEAEEFVEWYYSGNWCEKYEKGEDGYDESETGDYY